MKKREMLLMVGLAWSPVSTGTWLRLLATDQDLHEAVDLFVGGFLHAKMAEGDVLAWSQEDARRLAVGVTSLLGQAFALDFERDGARKFIRQMVRDLRPRTMRMNAAGLSALVALMDEVAELSAGRVERPAESVLH